MKMKLTVAISCAQQIVWTWKTLLSVILLIRFVPHAQSSESASSSQAISPSSIPDKVDIRSLLGSSELVQKLLQNKALLPFISSEASQPSPTPHDLNKLMARFKPKQGRLDPALMDMLSNFESIGAGIPSIFGNSQESSLPNLVRRLPTSTEENGIIWSTTTIPEKEEVKRATIKRKVIPYVRNRFSSKFRNSSAFSGGKNTTGKAQVTRLKHPPNLSDSDLVLNGSHPFGYITDPNLRNHRLYDWQFEDYKNFTHIDQEEDLMADESDPVPSVQIAPTSARAPVLTTIIPGGWIPKVGPLKPSRTPELQDPTPTSEFESVEYPTESEDASIGNVIPGTYVRLPSESEEPKRPPRPTARPREPLRESSTENRILPYDDDEDMRNRYSYRYKNNKDRFEEISSTGSSMRDDFRPSPPELSPPVFVDPDQDFFTSTIRNPSDDKSDEFDNVPGYRAPSKKHKKNPSSHRNRSKGDEDNKRRSRYETSSKKYYDSEEDYNRKVERERLELNRDITNKPSRNRDGLPERNNRDRSRDRLHLDQSDLKRPETSQESPVRSSGDLYSHHFRKSDRILNYDSSNSNRRGPSGSKTSLIKPKDPYSSEAQGTDHHPYYHSPYGPASNEFEFSNTRSPTTDQDYHQSDTSSSDYHQSNDNHHYSGSDDGNERNAYPETSHSNDGQGGYYSSAQDPYGNGNSEYSQGQSVDDSNAPRDQYYAGGYENQFNHPFGAPEDSNSYSPSGYGVEESSSSPSWLSSYYVLGGLVALSALLAFVIPTVLGSMGKHGKHRHDLHDEDLQQQGTEDFVDENTSTSTGGYYGSDSTTTSDLTSESDLWTEIKGVYNDIVNIVRGDYGGIVDKLTGNGGSLAGGTNSNKKSKKKDPNEPNIVYRDMEEEAEDDEKNDGNDLDAFENSRRNGKLRHRKGINVNSSNSPSSHGVGSSTTEHSNSKKNPKSRTLSSTINYVVRNNGYPEESSRGVSSLGNETMAGFHLDRSVLPRSNNASHSFPFSTSTEGFMGEWAKVQLIGN
jgi:hypothetical protein